MFRLWGKIWKDNHLLKDTVIQVTLDGNKVTMPEGVTLDLGAAGKGIGCDAAKKVLDADKNVSGMILNLACHAGAMSRLV